MDHNVIDVMNQIYLVNHDSLLVMNFLGIQFFFSSAVMVPYHFGLDPDPQIRIGEKRIRPNIEESFNKKIKYSIMIFVCYLLSYYSKLYDQFKYY